MADVYLRAVEPNSNDCRLYDPTRADAQVFTVDGIVACSTAVSAQVCRTFARQGEVAASATPSAAVSRTFTHQGSVAVQSAPSAQVARTRAVDGLTALQAGVSGDGLQTQGVPEAVPSHRGGARRRRSESAQWWFRPTVAPQPVVVAARVFEMVGSVHVPLVMPFGFGTFSAGSRLDDDLAEWLMVLDDPMLALILSESA